MRFKLIATIFSALGLIAGAAPGFAADIPVKAGRVGAPIGAPGAPAFGWAGLYAGVNAGYAWGNSTWDAPVGFSVEPKGWLAGATLGYNFQIGSIVFGVEGDYDKADVKGSAACSGDATCETKNTWLATTRVRVGYAFDRFLPYITAGPAYGHVVASTTAPLSGEAHDSVGWAMGGGIEHAFAENWTAKLEYLHVDLGKFDCGAGCVAGAKPNNISFKESIVRVGLNYKFSGLNILSWR